MNIFVYGANTQGRHGKGAALYAMQHHGAIYGKVGLVGNSYGIITKELRKNKPVITLDHIDFEIDLLIVIANEHPEHIFMCTPFGTGLAGFTHSEMKVLWSKKVIPTNIVLPAEWKDT